MPVTSLQLSNIGPFDSVEFTFDHQINVFTGANNTGKSTALWSLGELLVYPFAIPDRLLREPDSEWHIQIQTGHNHDNSSGRFPIDPGQLLPIYRTMGHSCFIPAQRHTSDYRSSGPTSKRDIESQIDEEIESMSQARPSLAAEIAPEDLRRMVRGWKTDQDPELTKRSDLMVSAAFFVSNEPLIQKIIDLDYRSLRLNRPDIRLVIKKAFEVVSDITQGFPIEFVGISEDERGLFPKVRTLKGELPITVLSQGTMSILHCISYLLFGYAEYFNFPRDLDSRPGLLIIDEIDAHLHPAWQQRMLPALTKHFPNLQIFCSTHSPLMLAGLKAGQAQLLRQDSDGNVNVSTNEADIVSWTVDEVLRHLLELDEPTDLATANQLERLEELRARKDPSTDEQAEIEVLRTAISSDLMSAPMAAQIAQFAEELRRADSRPEPSPTIGMEQCSESDLENGDH